MSFGLHAAALIATPLRRRGQRAGLASVVVVGLCGVTYAAAARRWGHRRSAATLASLAVGTLAIEKIGVSTGLPFGRYHYTSKLRPRIAGVPAIVPLAWFAMAVPSREVARAITPAWRVPLGAALLTAWDLFLDPQMVGEGYWKWNRVGRYRGIPLTNFLGWAATSCAVMALLDTSLPVDEPVDATLVVEYGWMAFMQTLGFAVFFGDPVVAAVGGSAMLPPAFAALRSLTRP